MQVCTFLQIQHPDGRDSGVVGTLFQVREAAIKTRFREGSTEPRTLKTGRRREKGTRGRRSKRFICFCGGGEVVAPGIKESCRLLSTGRPRPHSLFSPPAAARVVSMQGILSFVMDGRTCISTEQAISCRRRMFLCCRKSSVNL